MGLVGGHGFVRDTDLVSAVRIARWVMAHDGLTILTLTTVGIVPVTDTVSCVCVANFAVVTNYRLMLTTVNLIARIVRAEVLIIAIRRCT